MEILELIIKKYGKFSDRRMKFRSGLNVISGGNETGKTTVHSFIRAMFFGLNRARGRAANEDEYQLRQPWDSPGAFLGSMRIRENGKIYRIDRCFDHSAQPLSLVCETDATESSDPEADLNALLGGISEDAFVNSVFIPQMHSETNEALAEELRRYMINSDTSADGEIDVTGALSELRKKEKKCEQIKKKEESELEEKIAERQDRADALRTEIEQLKTRQDLPVKKRESEKPSGTVTPFMRNLLCVLLGLAAVLTAIGIFISNSLALSIFLGIFTILFGGMAFSVFFLFHPDMKIEEEQGDETFGEEEYDTSGADSPSGELRSKEESLQNLNDELEILYQQHAGPSGQDEEIEALSMAIDRICEISNGIFRANGGTLNEKASEILNEITCGRYSRITIDDVGEVRIHTPSRVLSLSQVSGGTLQQIYFALRMASAEIFCTEVQLPLVLDEPFAMYDDERLFAVLSWLKKSGRQVILFTCQNREEEILKQL